MARASARLISALRRTAVQLQRPETIYRWSRFAHCNCGHLAQTLTGLDPRTIETAASRHAGDWAEQARTLARRPSAQSWLLTSASSDDGACEPEAIDVCNVTRRTMVEIIASLQAWGLEPVDVECLERLSDYAVRQRLGTSTVDFPHGDRQNVIAYLNAWADLLEERLEADARSAPEAALDPYPVAAE
jgi:hypothetical protein